MVLVFMSVLVVIMGFGRSVRMGGGVHAKKNVRSNIEKENDFAKSEITVENTVIPSGAEGARCVSLKISNRDPAKLP